MIAVGIGSLTFFAPPHWDTMLDLRPLEDDLAIAESLDGRGTWRVIGMDNRITYSVLNFR